MRSSYLLYPIQATWFRAELAIEGHEDEMAYFKATTQPLCAVLKCCPLLSLSVSFSASSVNHQGCSVAW